MRPFRFACPSCSKVFSIKRAEHVGRRMRCTGCDATSTIRCASPADVPVGVGVGSAAGAFTGNPLRKATGGAARRALCPDVPAAGNEETFVMQTPWAVGTWVTDAAMVGSSRGVESLDVIEEILSELPEFAPGREPKPAAPIEAAPAPLPAPEPVPVAAAVEPVAPAVAAAVNVKAIEEIKAALAEDPREAVKHPVFDEAAAEQDSMLSAALMCKLLAEAEPLGESGKRDGESPNASARRAAVRKASRPEVSIPGRLLAPAPLKPASSKSGSMMITAGFKPPPTAAAVIRDAIPIDELDDDVEFGDTVAADALTGLAEPEPLRPVVFAEAPIKPALLRPDGSDRSGGGWTVVAMLMTLLVGSAAAAAGWLLLVTDGRALETAAALLP